ncbi:hypothetical protein RBB50_001145 [Rhinocladiella similis]
MSNPGASFQPLCRHVRIPSSTASQIPIALQVKYVQPTNADFAAPTILFLPFWGGCATTYDSVHEHAAAAGLRNIGVALSYRGTGESETSEADAPQEHSIEALASDVLAVLASEQFTDLAPSGEVVIVAHSMSAKVAWCVMRDICQGCFPRGSRRKVAVRRLLLLAPAPPGPLTLPPDMREQQMQAYQSIESATWTVKNVLTCGNLGHNAVDRLVRDAIAMSDGAKKGWVDLGMNLDCTDVVDQVMKTVPEFKVTVLAGRRDIVETADRVQSETVDVVNGLGNCAVRFRIIEGSGHLLPVEAPAEVVRELIMLNEA